MPNDQLSYLLAFFVALHAAHIAEHAVFEFACCPKFNGRRLKRLAEAVSDCMFGVLMLCGFVLAKEPFTAAHVIIYFGGAYFWYVFV